MAIVERDYRGDADFLLMRELTDEALRIDGPPDYARPGDLDWWRALDLDSGTLNAVRLWFDDDALVGFAWPDGDNLEMLTLPRYRALEPELLEWAEQRRRRETPTGGDPPELRAWALESDQRRQSLLGERGYQPTDEHHIYWLRLLDPPPPPRPLADGYSVRNVRGEADVEGRVAAHRSAFAPSRFSAEKYRLVRASPGYREDLDLVAVAPDGTIAAFCIVWYEPAANLGGFEPVGTHAEHQQRGLARAVMVEGMRRVVGLGAHSAVVLSGGGNDASYRLYQSAGFRPIDRVIAWRKPLSEAAPAQ